MHEYNVRYISVLHIQLVYYNDIDLLFIICIRIRYIAMTI